MVAVIILFLSVVISYKICKIINRNTIGTSSAYLRRAVFVWCIVMGILAGVANKIGLI